MNYKNTWQTDLEEYIRQGEAEQSEKSIAWKTAIGLQDVDGLKTSEYLLETAKEHIEGKIDISTAQERISNYYEVRTDRKNIENDTKEADIVSTRITQLLSEKAFQFSPAELFLIHKRLFTGVFKHAGEIRSYNISKKEWVLKGDSVFYASFESIKDTLDYDFNQEKAFSYEGLTIQKAIEHISDFTAGIWQIHPFCEGNTRTTAVFILKYLSTFGFSLSNSVFAKNSWYFRNALVRANYNNLQKGISSTTKYLNLFFENLLLNANHDLKNRYLHIDYNKNFQSATYEISKCQNDTFEKENGTLELSLEDLVIIKALKENPQITQKDLAVKVGKSERSIKRKTVLLQEKGFIKRESGKRNGKWIVLIDNSKTN